MLTKNQIQIIENIYRKNLSIQQLRSELNISYITLIRNLKILKTLDLITQNNLPSNSLLALRLKELVDKHINVNFLKKTNFKVLQVLLHTELTISQIQKATNLKKTQVYKIIKELKNQSVVYQENRTYKLNLTLWSELRDFIIIYQSTVIYLNNSLPKNSKILFKGKDKMLFENKDSNLNYKKTAFSRYNFDLYYNTTIYMTQKEELTKEQIYLDSLNIAQSQREYLLCSIYYLKNKFKNINHPTHKKIISILEEGKNYKGFPTKEDIITKEK